MTAPSGDLTVALARQLRGLVHEAVLDASAAQWHKRADTFTEATPRRGDYHGKATPAELSARWKRCMATAAACRAHAGVIERHGLDAAIVTSLDLALVEELYRAAA